MALLAIVKATSLQLAIDNSYEGTIACQFVHIGHIPMALTSATHLLRQLYKFE